MQDPLAESLSQQQRAEKSALQVRLLKGPVYRAKLRDLWLCLERDQFLIREYFQQIGLTLVLDDAEGYAFLKQQDFEPGEDKFEIPRLISRRAMSFSNTLLVVLLRKRLAEHDSEDSSPRLMVNRAEIHQWLQPFFATVSNEVKQRREFDGLIKKIIAVGFLTALPHHQDEFEVQRIIKAMINAEQIVSVLDKLSEYKNRDVN